MPDLPEALQTDNHVLWALIAVSVGMILTLEAVQTAVEGAWPHQRRPSTMLPAERNAQSMWGLVAIALIAGGLLLIANLAILLWKELDTLDLQVTGAVLLGVSWVFFLLVSIDRFGIRRYITSIGLAAPIAVLALLAMAIILLTLALIDIWPPADDFRESLPVLVGHVR
jgi:magnesium-transporting ATPase (P-type)